MKIYDRLYGLYRELVECFDPRKMRVLRELRDMKH